ncbi:MAG: ABC transporter substrate-binding protein [Chloroflexi bacterium]|nr:ABC transporter substrate-binding protein [Chloroflexota bacterium]
MRLDRRFDAGRRRLLAGGAAALATACGVRGRRPESGVSREPNVEYTVERPIPSEIRLGAAFPFSGPHVDVGLALRAGYELAVNEVNGRGGIWLSEYQRQVQVRLILYDDQGHPTRSRQLYERLVEYDRVDALLGGFGGAAAARLGLAEERGVPYVSGLESVPDDFRDRRYGFGFGPLIAELAATQLAWLSWSQDRDLLRRPVRIGLLSRPGEAGANYRASILDQAGQDPSRFDLILDQRLPSVQPADYRPLVRDLRGAEPDALLADTTIEAAIVLHRQVAVLRPAPRVISYGLQGNHAAMRAQLGPAADGLVTATGWSSALGSDAAQGFATRFSGAYGRTAEAEHTFAYGAAAALVEAIGRAGTLSARGVREALTAGGAPPCLPGGATRVEGTTFTRTRLLLVQNVPDGREVVVWPSDLRAGEASGQTARV